MSSGGKTSRRAFLGVAALGLSAGMSGCSGIQELTRGSGSNSGGGSSDADGPVSIEYGQTIQRTLQDGDGRDPEYYDLAEPVTFPGTGGERIVITMRSDTFDPYVVLEAPDGSTAEVADDGAGDYDAELRTTLSQTGEYVIWAGSLSGTETGTYELSLRRS